MNRLPLVLFFLCLCTATYSQPWKPAGDKVKTPWSDKVDPSNPLPDYPRPMLVRDQWLNLNGLWDYAIVPKGSAIPNKFDGAILVPFPVESSLSGVQRTVGEDQELWYSRKFSIPAAWKNKHILLHFGAVDWKTDVWINNIKIGSHQGGYTGFSFDITALVSGNAEQEVVVRVWDPTDKGWQPRGKQVTRPGGIWYTAVTGIWQTVWLEPVTESHVTRVVSVADIDRGTVSVTVQTAAADEGDLTEVRVIRDGTVISKGMSLTGQEVLLPVPDARLWSPEDPYLYTLEVSLLRNGKVVDKAGSYFGMRKISVKRDGDGVVRMQLNNKNYFQFGLLDQGWWPDGLYTAPTDEALRSDITKTKEFGYNLIRKHVKVEPARWYYHCDKEGILVWQDMPSGDRGPQWQTTQYFNGQERIRLAESEQHFRSEWKSIIDMLKSNPCVVSWIPFNESWGQFKTIEIAEWTKSYDPGRLINPASGGNFYPVGDILDIHNYPEPKMTLYDGNRVCVLGEYGGLGLALEGHLWEKDRNWGYVQYKSPEEVTDAYTELAEQLMKLIPSGFSAAIYTQTTDVEIEVNGIMTYDRRVVKLDPLRLKEINREVIQSLK